MSVTVNVKPYDVSVLDHDGTAEVRLWCFGQNDERILMRVTDCPVFCFLELPSIMEWDAVSAQVVIQWLSDMLNKREDHAPEKAQFGRFKKLYYYRGDFTFPMIMLKFKSLEALRHAKNVLCKPRHVSAKVNNEIHDLGELKMTLLEHDIPLDRKLFTLINARYTQWLEAKATPADPSARVSIPSVHEYTVSRSQLKPIPPEQTETWKVRPRLFAFDCEMYSHNHRAMPNEMNARHVIYMVSCIFQVLGDPATLKRYAIVLGLNEVKPCNPIENVEVITVSTETELIYAYCDLIKRHDPDIITGYNILGFDNNYMDVRLGMKMQDWPDLGRLEGVQSYMRSSSWKSSGYGHNSFCTLMMDGRITIDVLPVVRHDYKLPRYGLGPVSQEFIKKTKHDIKAPEMFTIYEQLVTALTSNIGVDAAVAQMTRVTEYCVQDSQLVIELFEKLNVWEGMDALSSVVGVPIKDVHTRGQQIRCRSQIYDLAKKEGYVLNKRDMPKVNISGGFVGDPIVGFHKNVPCLDFASLYPSIIQAYNICYTTLVPPEQTEVINPDLCHISDFTQEEKINPDEINNENEDEEEEKEDKKTVTKHYHFKFVKEGVRKGLLPKLVEQLVAERNAVRRRIEELKTKMKQMSLEERMATEIVIVVLDKRQLALKVSANSMYGFLGVQVGGLMPLIEGSMSVTAWGRKLINLVNEFLIREHNARIVYNDTDSVMVDLGLTDPAEAVRMGKLLSRQISGTPDIVNEDGSITPGEQGLFMKPLKMEFEKAMWLLSLKKKKYAALLINSDGSFKKSKTDPLKNEIMVKGIVLARRDNCEYLRMMYRGVLEAIMEEANIGHTFRMIGDFVMRLFGGGVNIKDLVIIRELGSEYASESSFMRIFADELRRQGFTVSPGDRLEYVIVSVPEEQNEDVLLGYKLRHIELYTDEPIDYNYYLGRLLKNPIDQLFEVGYTHVMHKYAEVGFKPSNRRKFCGINQPIKLLMSHLEAGHNLSEVIAEYITQLI